MDLISVWTWLSEQFGILIWYKNIFYYTIYNSNLYYIIIVRVRFILITDYERAFVTCEEAIKNVFIYSL